MQYLGTGRPGSTVYIPLNTYGITTTPGASLTATLPSPTLVNVYKEGGVTQRSSQSGLSVLGIDFDSLTGAHGFSIDTSDNGDSGFWDNGAEYFVNIPGLTVDSQTVNPWVGHFRLGYEDAIIDTNIATVTDQQNITLAGGSVTASSLVGCQVVVTDLTDPDLISIGYISNHGGGSPNDITLRASPDFTIAAGDHISIFRPTDTAEILSAVFASAGSASGLTQTAGFDSTQSPNLTGVALVGTVSSPGSYLDLGVADNSVMTITHAANEIDYTVGFTVPANTTPISVNFIGSVQGSNDTGLVFVYDNDATSWVQVASIAGKNDATDDPEVVIPLGEPRWVNSGNEVLVRFDFSGSAQILTLNKLTVSYENTSVGYSGGFLYYDESANNTGTAKGSDGTADNPVSSWAALSTLASSTQLTRIRATGLLTLGGSATGFSTIESERGSLDLNGQAIGGVEFRNFEDVYGTGVIGTSPETRPDFTECGLAISTTLTLPPSRFRFCELGSNTITAGSSGDWDVDHCSSGVSGAGGVTLNFNSTGNNTIGVTNWFRSLTVSGLAATDQITCDGRFGDLVLNGAGVSSGRVYGSYRTYTNNLTASPSGVDDTGAYPASYVGDVQKIFGNASAAEGLMASARAIIWGTVSGSPIGNSVIPTDLSAYAADELIDGLLIFYGGTAAGQRALITDSDGTGTLTVNALTTTPVENDPFVIV